MFRNDYGHAIAKWKTDLIVARAKRLGFRRHDLEDVQQQVVMAVLAFTFEPAKSNGATEVTALTALIDRQLKAMQRAKARYARRVSQQLDELDEVALSLEDSFTETLLAQSLDVRQAVVDLPPPTQQICNALAAGSSVSDIARTLDTSWHSIRRQVQGIRRYFEGLGLEEWIVA